MEQVIGDAKAIIDAVQKLAPAETIESGKIVALPSGKGLHSLKGLLDEYLPRPERREGKAALESLDAFCDYVNRFKSQNTVLFAAERREKPGVYKPCLAAVIDHFEAGSETPNSGSKADWRLHRAFYDFPLSDEWLAWHAVDGKGMDVREMSEFLEDRVGDVGSPQKIGATAKDFVERSGIRLASAAELVDLSKGLKVRVDQRVTQMVNTQTGEMDVMFTESHGDMANTSQKLAVPGGFVIGIPVFRHGPLYEVCARLRYRVAGGGITWIVKLHRTDRIFDAAFTEALTKAQANTECPLFRGSPEV